MDHNDAFSENFLRKIPGRAFVSAKGKRPIEAPGLMKRLGIESLYFHKIDTLYCLIDIRVLEVSIYIA